MSDDAVSGGACTCVSCEKQFGECCKFQFAEAWDDVAAKWVLGRVACTWEEVQDDVMVAIPRFIPADATGTLLSISCEKLTNSAGGLQDAALWGPEVRPMPELAVGSEVDAIYGVVFGSKDFIPGVVAKLRAPDKPGATTKYDVSFEDGEEEVALDRTQVRTRDALARWASPPAGVALAISYRVLADAPIRAAPEEGAGSLGDRKAGTEITGVPASCLSPDGLWVEVVAKAQKVAWVPATHGWMRRQGPDGNDMLELLGGAKWPAPAAAADAAAATVPAAAPPAVAAAAPAPAPGA